MPKLSLKFKLKNPYTHTQIFNCLALLSVFIDAFSLFHLCPSSTLIRSTCMISDFDRFVVNGLKKEV